MRILLGILLVFFTSAIVGQPYFLSLEPQDENHCIGWVYSEGKNVFWLEYPKEEYRDIQKQKSEACPLYIHKSSLSQPSQILWQRDHYFTGKFELTDSGVLFSTISDEGLNCWEMNRAGCARGTFTQPKSRELPNIKSFPLSLYEKDALKLEIAGDNSLFLRWQITLDNLLFHDEWELELPSNPVPEKRFSRSQWEVLFHPQRSLVFFLPSVQKYSLSLLFNRLPQDSKILPASTEDLYRYASRYYLGQEILLHAVLSPLERSEMENLARSRSAQIPLLEINMTESGKEYRCLVSVPQRKARFLPTSLESGETSVHAYLIPNLRGVMVFESPILNATLPAKIKEALGEKLAAANIRELQDGLDQPCKCDISSSLKSQMPSVQVAALAVQNRLRIIFLMDTRDYNILRIHLQRGLPLDFVWKGSVLGLAQDASPSATLHALYPGKIEEITMDEKYLVRIDMSSAFWQNYPGDCCHLLIKYAGCPERKIQLNRADTEKLVDFPLARDQRGEPIYLFEYRWNKKDAKGIWQEGKGDVSRFPALFLME